MKTLIELIVLITLMATPILAIQIGGASLSLYDIGALFAAAVRGFFITTVALMAIFLPLWIYHQ